MAKAKELPLPKNLSEEAREEILERRRVVAAEQEARERERKEAWVEHQREKVDAEERRKATEPPKEFVEAARAARERIEKEKAGQYRRAYDAEAKRRNPDEVLEKRFHAEHEDVAVRHLALFARLQEAMLGSDELEKREVVREMAAAWKEKEDLLIALAAKKRKNAPDPLEAKTELLKDKLEDMEKSRASAERLQQKPKKAVKVKKAEKPASAEKPAKKPATKKPAAKKTSKK